MMVALLHLRWDALFWTHHTLKPFICALVRCVFIKIYFCWFQEDSYVLPLRWWGLTVRMLCPLMRQSSSNPPMVSCHTEGMVVKTEWTVSITKIHVKCKFVLFFFFFFLLKICWGKCIYTHLLLFLSYS